MEIRGELGESHKIINSISDRIKKNKLIFYFLCLIIFIAIIIILYYHLKK